MALLEAGSRLLVLPGRGYALVRGGGAAAARGVRRGERRATLLRGCLAAADGAELGRSSSSRAPSTGRWAPCLEAGLELRPRAGRCSWAATSVRSRPISPAAPYL